MITVKMYLVMAKFMNFDTFVNTAVQCLSQVTRVVSFAAIVIKQAINHLFPGQTINQNF